MLNYGHQAKHLLVNLIHFLFFMSLCAFESSTFSPSKSLIEVDLWLIPLVFIALHRSALTNLLFVPLAAFALSGFTGTPHYQLLLSLSTSIIFVFFLKRSSYSKGNAYFSISLFSCILSFHIFLFLTHLIFEETAPHLRITWLISSLSTPAFIFLIKPVLIFIDSLFDVSYPFGFEV